MRQARELGINQPFFVGSNMVDPSLVTAARANAEGVTGFSLIPFLPGATSAEMKQWEANWRKEYASAPAGRPNNFDLLAYGDMHVLAEGMRRAGKNLTTDTLIKGLESIKDYRVGPVATPRTFSDKHHIGNLTLVPMQVKGGSWEPVQWQSKRQSDILSRYK
jgi:branched-chain amino acid transport system substrate-binding protein